MDLATCMAHDKYCLGQKDVKLCCMCKNKQVSDHLDSLPIDQQVELKETIPMISSLTCKATNASYYVSSK